MAERHESMTRLAAAIAFAVIIGAMSLLQKPETVEFQVLDQLEGSRSVEAIRARNFSMKR